MEARALIEGSMVELEMCSETDTPPAEEAALLRESLGKLYPATPSGRAIHVLLAWSSRRQAWKIRSAKQRVGDVAYVERAMDVARTLAGLGYAVEVSANPMDSPPDGIRVPGKA